MKVDLTRALSKMRPGYQVFLFVVWTGLILAAVRINGGWSRFENPKSVMLLGIAAILMAITLAGLIFSSRIRGILLRPGVTIEDDQAFLWVGLVTCMFLALGAFACSV